MIVKIQNSDGLFSTGGSEGRVRFTKKGKTWSSLGFVKTHLRLHREASIRKTYVDCKIVMIDDENGYSVEELDFDTFLQEFMDYEKKRIFEDERKRLLSKKRYLKNQIDEHKKEIEEIDKTLSNI